MKEQEALQTTALIREFPDAIQHQIHYLLSDGVVTASVVVCRILLTGDELLRMEELTICARAYLI